MNISVTPLGTVSPYPKGNMNCPGILVEFDNKKILLDCGSGISRLFKFPKDLKKLIIILSHLHKDHYSDISSFAYGSYVYHNLGMLDEKIPVYLPVSFGDYNSADYKFIKSLEDESFFEYIDDIGRYQHDCVINYENSKISFCKNIHPIRTYSTKINVNGVIIIYTSDTAYNSELIRFAKNADLLICESTFLKGQHCTNGHMYAYEAGKLAKNANVKQLMLTHFWPEISKENYVNEAKEYFENTIAAEEGQKLVLRRN